MLQAGIARSTITPPIGMTMLGYAGREGLAQGTDADLTATALVLENNGTRVAIVGFDLAFLHGDMLQGIKNAFSEALQTPTSHVLLNCSHTHCGPTMNGYFYDDDPDQHKMRADYEAGVVEEMRTLASTSVYQLTQEASPRSGRKDSSPRWSRQAEPWVTETKSREALKGRRRSYEAPSG